MDKIRRRMVEVVAISTAAVFALTCLILGVIMFFTIAYEADSLTELIKANNGRMPKYSDIQKQDENEKPKMLNSVLTEESEFATRYFIVYLDENLNYHNSRLDNIAAIDEIQAAALQKHAIRDNKDTGYVDKYRYRFVNEGAQSYIIFLDCQNDLKNAVFTVTLAVIIGVLLTIMISLIFIFTSKRAIRPFEENAKKQRQFITDAGHELKTPLAIISANADVIGYKSQESKEWVDSIKDQVNNLSNLISELLILSKSEEVNKDITLEEVNFSEVVAGINNEYKGLFASKNAKVDVTIEENITLPANKESLDRLIHILYDNCTKYTPENGDVVVSLNKGFKYSIFSISNTDTNDEKIDCRRMFDRFYRTDTSRNSSTGGHGIGLSIAYRICTQHNGSISAKQENGMMTFTASIPNKNSKYKAS